MQIQISWLLQKPTDLDLHCLQKQGYLGSVGQGLRKHDNDDEEDDICKTRKRPTADNDCYICGRVFFCLITQDI